VADHRDAAQVQHFEHSGKVVGEGVEVVAAPRVARSPVASPVEGHAPEALLREREHLVVPRVRR
jgi:hypothetical protein